MVLVNLNRLLIFSRVREADITMLITLASIKQHVADHIKQVSVPVLTVGGFGDASLTGNVHVEALLLNVGDYVGLGLTCGVHGRPTGRGENRNCWIRLIRLVISVNSGIIPVVKSFPVFICALNRNNLISKGFSSLFIVLRRFTPDLWG